MKHIKLKSLQSGLIMGYVLERINVNGVIEYVVQSERGRFFVRHSENIALLVK